MLDRTFSPVTGVTLCVGQDVQSSYWVLTFQLTVVVGVKLVAADTEAGVFAVGAIHKTATIVAGTHTSVGALGFNCNQQQCTVSEFAVTTNSVQSVSSLQTATG